MPIKQGTINYLDFQLDTLESLRVLEINSPNINNEDVWVANIDTDGTVLSYWTQTDNVLNESLAYNSLNTEEIFEVITRDQDQVAIRFGDGKFGKIPQGIFRVWFRTSSPTPYLVKSNDILRQTVSIPYVSDSQVWALSLELSLQSTISTAAETESLDEIKQKASRIFYTQNRMVNGEDYNNYPLSDNSILKVKAINRTFAGKSKNLNITDNTGAYDNISLYGTDGRIYKEYKTTTSQSVYNAILQSLETYINTAIAPLLETPDKQIFYYNNYNPISYSQDLAFTVDSTIEGRSKGHFNEDITATAVNHFLPDAIINFSNGESARLDYVTAGTTGSEANTVSLKKNVNFTSQYVTTIFPPLRTVLTVSEKTLINERMALKKPFGIRWDFDNQYYTVIKAENLSNADFSLTYVGDTSATNKDSSWIVKLDYNYSQNGEDFWTISERGLFYTFESESQVNFINVNDKTIVDYASGKQLRDTVTLLTDNESKMSLPRRGAKTVLGNDPYAGKIVLTGDGTTSSFEIETDKMSSTHVFFEVNNVMVVRSDWVLSATKGRYYIKFDEPLGLGEIVTVVYDPRKTNMVALRTDIVSDGVTDTFGLIRQNIRSDNTFVFESSNVQACFSQYNIYPTSVDDRLKLTYLPTVNAPISIITLSDGEPIFNSYTFVSDGIQTQYQLRMHSNLIMIWVGGLLFRGYTINTDLGDADVIVFTTPPTAGAEIHIKALINPSLAQIDHVAVTATAGQQQFTCPADPGEFNRILTFVSGYFQHEATFDEETNMIILSAACTGGEHVEIFHLTVTAANTLSYDIIERLEYNAKADYLSEEVAFLVYDQSRFTDGYTNTKAVQITNVDADFNGDIDDPLNFSELVIEDGLSDLVLWQKIEENGFDILQPLSETSTPRGTYHSKLYNYVAGDTLTTDIIDGSVHYDYPNSHWLVADTLNNVWAVAPDETIYKALIGRSGIKFKWDHYTSSEQQINASSSNLHDMYVLTKAYDRAVRTWVTANDGTTMPTPPSLVALKTAYTYLLDHKMASDTVIWNPATYKFLFGPQALSELQCKFLVVKTVGATIPNNDLKLKILSVIDDYFSIQNWDFGDRFYFTELAAYVHVKLSTYVQTFVPVALNGEPFGRLFEVRAEPNEIFLNTASPTQIEVVDSLTDARLNIKF